MTLHDRIDALTAEQWIQIGAAGATFLAVLVALFQEKIRDYFNRAELQITIPHIRPHSHKIKIIAGQYSGGLITDEVIYVRILIEHLKGDAAENVEVMLTQCWEYNQAGESKPRENFLPMNLVWSHFQPPQHTIRVPSGLFRHCDLGYLKRHGGSTRFKFDTIVQPNEVGDAQTWPNMVGPGKYEIELQTSGDNTRTVTKRWLIEIDGNWDDAEERMLQNHLKITEVQS
jgi:hypothetical protein